MQPDNFQPNGGSQPDPYIQPQFSPNPYAGSQPIIPIEAPSSRSASLGIIIGFSVTLFFLVGFIIFSAWAYTGRQDYKNNSDQKVAAAVEIAREEEAALKDAQFAEAVKYPFKEYNGPEPYGSVQVVYPKTWSAVVSETDKTMPVEGYFHPDYIPGLDSGAAFALRIRVIDKSYADSLKSYDAAAKRNKVKAVPYSLPKVPEVSGSRLEGEIDKYSKNGSMVLLPLRDKTLEITTLSSDYVKDFDSIILENLSFVP